MTQNFIGACAIQSLIGTVARSIFHLCALLVRSTAVLATIVGLLNASPALAAFFTPGKFDVTPSGAASYTVPIAVPPGTAGMAPSIALSYNSQGGNGLLGMGWSLSGLSAITRCPKTFIQDGVKSGVSYTVTDSLCLDGQRLVAVPNANGITGSYGANGTEYRTETESFSRIISYGSSGTPVSGPGYFKVWTKSGQVMEFGNTADSAVETQGLAATAAIRPIRVWTVNKITDSKGNYLIVKYAKDTVTWGSYVPTTILYTGNATSTPVLLPYSHVDFHLLTRTDTPIGYDGGSAISTPWLIDHIYTYTVVKGIDTMIKDYRLTYGVSTATKRSKLSQLQECDGGATTATCLPPTKFSWQDEVGGLFAFKGAIASLPVGQISFGMCAGCAISADFNGDGKDDFLINTMSTGWNLYFSNGDGTFNSAFTTPPITGTPMLGDFNGDGRLDIISDTQVYLSNGNGTFTAISSPATTPLVFFSTTPPGPPMLGDFDGDGKTDFIINYDLGGIGGWKVFLSNGDGTFRTNLTTQFNVMWSNPMPGDFNGDGKTDLMINAGGAGWYVYLSNGDGTFRYVSSPTPYSVWNSPTAGDFNGDGKTDFMINTVTPGAGWYVYLSNGDGTFRYASSPTPYVPWNSPTVGDFNGDGKSDFMIDTVTPGAGWYTYLSNGDGTFRFVSTAAPYGMYTPTPGDYNGDGQTDFIVSNGSPITPIWSVYLSNSLTSSPLPDLMNSVTNGLGAATSISYKPLTDSTVYTKASTGIYPVVDIQAPMYVVSSVSSSNGIGGNYVSNYNYVGAKSHLTGGGFLGFNQTINTDVQTGIVSTTTYRQDYPLQGLPLTAQKNTSTGVQLNNVSNTWTSTGNAAWSAQYHVPLLTQSVESSYELTGGLISTVTTATSYDTYGNPTMITVSTPDGYSKITTNTYVNDTVNWYLGRLTSAAVNSIRPDLLTPNATGVTSTAVTINWTAVPGATAYVVYINGLMQPAVAGTATSQTITGLTAGTSYNFRVAYRNAAGVLSSPSAVLSIVTLGTAPVSPPPVVAGTAPTPTATGVTATGLTLNWTPVTGATSYVVYQNGLMLPLVAGTGTSRVVTGLTSKTSYNFRVAFRNSAGVLSATSGILTVVTL